MTAKSKKSKWTQQRDDYFSTKFKKFFSQWKARNPKKNTQREFARLICDIREKKNGEKCPVTNNYVSEWIRGKWFPEEYLPEIAELLGVKEDCLDLSKATREELYQYASGYMTELVDNEAVPYCSTIGLNLDFLYAVRSMMGESFDVTFPIWTPIRPNPQRASVENYIRSRSSLAVSAQTDTRQSVFQVNTPESIEDESNRRFVTMSRADLEFLRDLQEEVNDYIEFQFLRRLKGQIKEVEEANRLSRVPRSDGGYAIRRLKAEELNRIDKYFHGYTDKRPDPEVRDATQEDMDNFTNGGQTITDKNGLKVEVGREATQEDWDGLLGKSGGK